MNMKQIGVLLVDDHMVVREGFRSLLETDGSVKVVGQAKNGREAIELVKKLSPDVVIMDIAMPDLNGFEATRQILKTNPAARILILSAHDDDAYVDHVMELGAAGYLVKQTSGISLLTAVRQVAKGKGFFSPSIAKRLASRSKTTPNHAGVLSRRSVKLSPRETQTLQLIAEGKANKQIADDLGISIKTVEKHRQNLMDKLNVHDTAGLTRHAISTGVIEGRGGMIAI